MIDFLGISNEVQMIILTAFATAVMSTFFNVIKDVSFIHKNQKTETARVKLAIATELQAILDLYEPIKLKKSPPTSGDDIKVIRINSDYNTVYRNNADKLGLMDKNVVKTVVTAYTLMNAFIDTLSVLAYRWESMVAAQRAGQDTTIYFEDVQTCHEIAYEQQETTLTAINNAITALNGGNNNAKL